MKHPWPHFKLTRVMSDGSREAVVLPVHKLTLETKVGRRAFFGVSGAAATLGTLAVAGCGSTTTSTDSGGSESADTSTDTDTGGSMAPATSGSGSYDTSSSYATDTTYTPPPPPPPPSSDSSSSGGEEISQPCTSEPVPAGYECTCNCVEE